MPSQTTHTLLDKEGKNDFFSKDTVPVLLIEQISGYYILIPKWVQGK